ncbi:class I SAM-dependent methyltransferase [Mycobacterium talmoniae]|uniref:S-adenosyl-L-methionine-dependent methyltransferase n=1 Tax=Mycobacterium talmoniae TaxID=1858794 RepID=A0A1S1NFU5_9MYCO|nr:MULTISPECIES: class I SAM-dependent methyltransferase [Mycobacterium]OHV04564.1 SAM-dependent methyltransferase [Mycobacterium talmoniae]TDH52901.1 SAM-dependent methyltransferase [Mycobacterium eburneum]
MPRTDDDTWDITESVGATALGVAAARAAETESENPLISDPFARAFLDAAGQGIWSVYIPSALPDDVDPEVRAQTQAMVDFMAVRTVFFDEVFLAAAEAGVRQIVILAAGLDARSWRLPWPDGTTVYELDQPKVLDFKAATLRRQGAHPTANLVPVPVDLRQDWPQALQDSGFDPAQPTAWSAEGLLRYLPAWAQDLLFERIQALSADGSWLAANATSGDALEPDRLARQRARMQRLRSVAARLVDTEVPDYEDLWYPEERTDVAAWLGDHGWDASTATLQELLARHGRRVSDDLTPGGLFISARRPLR